MQDWSTAWNLLNEKQTRLFAYALFYRCHRRTDCLFTEKAPHLPSVHLHSAQNKRAKNYRFSNRELSLAICVASPQAACVYFYGLSDNIRHRHPKFTRILLFRKYRMTKHNFFHERKIYWWCLQVKQWQKWPTTWEKKAKVTIFCWTDSEVRWRNQFYFSQCIRMLSIWTSLAFYSFFQYNESKTIIDAELDIFHLTHVHG